MTVTIDPTRRVVLKIGKFELNTWTSVRVTRHLHEICGSYELQYLDTGREAEALTDLVNPIYFAPVEAGAPCTILIDGEVVLKGWVEKTKLSQKATSLSAAINGRDVCGDLVDCAASPTGPAEFAKIDLAQLTRQICAPFGISVIVQTDVGPPLIKLANSPHEKALSAIDKAARQRSVLVVSDGVGNLVLTTAGTSRAPAGVTVGVNVVEAEYEDDTTKRFSDIWVKAQTARARGNHDGVNCTYTPTSAAGGADPDTTATEREAAGIVMTGHAKDPEITRYRPDVRVVRTQSGSSTVQQQAEWHVRVDRGQAKRVSYTVLDWRAGPDLQLWRPNTLVAVYDPYAEIDDDMLIDGVDFIYSEEDGERTTLHLVGKTAYDRTNEPARRRQRHHQRQTP